MTSPTNSSNSRALPSGFCSAEGQIVTFLSMTAVALVILVAFAFVQKRRRLCHGCLGGRPGLVAPMKILLGFRNRFAYTMAFGATSVQLFFMVSYGISFGSTSRLARSILTPMIVLLPCLYNAPLFVSIDAPRRVLGYVVGLLYSTTLSLLLILLLALCGGSEGFLTSRAARVAILMPYLCLFVLAAWFIIRLVQEVRLRFQQTVQEDENCVQLEPHQIRHVCQLLRKEKVSSFESNATNKTGHFQRLRAVGFRLWFDEISYKSKDDFLYPLRILSTTFICILCVYMMLAISIDAVVQLDNLTEKGIAQIIANTNFSVSVLRNLSDTFNGCAFCSTILASIIVSANAIHALVCYRKHMFRIYRGNRSFLPRDATISNIGPVSVVAGALRYAGYQIGHVVWGWTLISMLLLAALVAVSAFGWLIKLAPQIIVIGLEVLIGPFIISFVVFFGFTFACRSLLEKPREHMAIQNRRLYQAYYYFLLFYNVLVGLFSALFRRVIPGLVAGFVLLQRLDRPILPRGLELRDGGYRSYICSLYVDNLMTNPAMVAFCALLQKSIRKENSSQGDEELKIQEVSKYKSCRLRNRWHLALTLHNNPSLIRDRVHNLPSDDSCLDQKDIKTLKADDVVLVDEEKKHSLHEKLIYSSSRSSSSSSNGEVT
ncbi:stimulated by retinoic acid gene 6 protein-like isoform X2 [Oscarella lobularis]|uniref:stimulated by retinoic acid gene 6 protein-like isoform X2 n=1 Tax=Oscarella lobularis TaxID=121494 RepID=UPI0033134591